MAAYISCKDEGMDGKAGLLSLMVSWSLLLDGDRKLSRNETGHMR